MDNNYQSNKIAKPKLSVYKAINKFLIAWDLKKIIYKKCPVFYAWEPNKQSVWIDNGFRPIKPYIGVDYDPYKREWYISYVVNAKTVYFGTIDDLTGSIEIDKLD